MKKKSVELGLELNLNSVEKRLDTRHFKEPLKHLLKVKLSKNALRYLRMHIQSLWESKLKRYHFILLPHSEINCISNLFVPNSDGLNHV